VVFRWKSRVHHNFVSTRDVNLKNIFQKNAVSNSESIIQSNISTWSAILYFIVLDYHWEMTEIRYTMWLHLFLKIPTELDFKLFDYGIFQMHVCIEKFPLQATLSWEIPEPKILCLTPNIWLNPSENIFMFSHLFVRKYARQRFSCAVVESRATSIFV